MGAGSSPAVKNKCCYRREAEWPMSTYSGNAINAQIVSVVLSSCVLNVDVSKVNFVLQVRSFQFRMLNHEHTAEFGRRI